MNLADNLKKIRKEQGLSQEELADKLNVSRQSVSKWESGTAYPEMDKVIQLCKLFNVNIDELLNQNIKEVNNSKQSKNYINTLISSVLDYVTKTIDMFSSMKFKEKIKCLFEQAIIICILAILLSIVGEILSSVFDGFMNALPYNIERVLAGIFESLYILFAVFLEATLTLHIFKTRYLDYYEIVNNEEIKEKNIKEENTEKKILLEKKQEKIIIRDPNHTGYKFITSLLKLLIFFIKAFVAFIGVFFCMSLIGLVISFVLSFVIIKSGLLFIGIILVIMALIVINLVVLNIIYNIIVSHKNKVTVLALSFIISVVVIGAGIGISTLGLRDFKVIHLSDDKHFIEKTETISMTNNLFFNNDYFDINYVENDSKEIEVLMKSSKYHDIMMHKNNEHILFYLTNKENNINHINEVIDDINHHQFVDYSDYEITIYTSKSNIDKLKSNYEVYRKGH